MKKLLIIAILSILAFTLVGCSDTKHIQIPTEQQMQTYVWEHHTTGMPLEQYVIIENDDQFANWQERTDEINGQKEYMEKTAYWADEKKKLEDGEYWSEEARIEAYCEENGYLHCIGITETCMKDGCYKVTITCEDDDFDVSKLDFDTYKKKYECNDYEVIVDEDTN